MQFVLSVIWALALRTYVTADGRPVANEGGLNKDQLATLFRPLFTSVAAHDMTENPKKALAMTTWPKEDPACYWVLDSSMRVLANAKPAHVAVETAVVIRPGIEYGFHVRLPSHEHAVTNRLVCTKTFEETSRIDALLLSRDAVVDVFKDGAWTFRIAEPSPSALKLCTSLNECYGVSVPSVTLSLLLKLEGGYAMKKDVWKASVFPVWNPNSPPQQRRTTRGVFSFLKRQKHQNVEDPLPFTFDQLGYPSEPASMLLRLQPTDPASPVTGTVCCRECGASAAVFYDVRNALTLAHDERVHLLYRPRMGITGRLARSFKRRCKPVSLVKELQRELDRFLTQAGNVWNIAASTGNVRRWEADSSTTHLILLDRFVFRDPFEQKRGYVSITSTSYDVGYRNPVLPWTNKRLEANLPNVLRRRRQVPAAENNAQAFVPIIPDKAARQNVVATSGPVSWRTVTEFPPLIKKNRLVPVQWALRYRQISVAVPRVRTGVDPHDDHSLLKRPRDITPHEAASSHLMEEDRPASFQWTFSVRTDSEHVCHVLETTQKNGFKLRLVTI